MKTRLQLPLFTVLLSLLCLGLSSGVSAQGLEDFTNLPTNNASSYLARSWTGTDGVNWNAEGVRTDQTLNGKAICWGNSGNRNVISPTYTGGMGVLTFNYVRAFTGTGARSLEVFVNGVQIGDEITVSPTSNDVIQYTESINVSGNVVLEIRSTGAAQVKVDDVNWTAYSTTESFLSATPPIMSGLNYTEGSGPSNVESFEVSGSNLVPTDGNISVTAPLNFEVSLDNSIFSSSILLPYTGGTLSETEIFVRLAAGLDAGAYDGSIDISGGDASALVSLQGTVIEPFGLPYFNGLRNQTDWDEAESIGFVFNGTSFQTAAGGYVRMPLNAAIVSPAIDFSESNLIVASFDLTTFDGNTGQELTVFVSDNNGLDYIALDTFSVPGSYQTFTQYIDVSALNGANGLIKFEMTGGANQIRFRDLNLGVYEGYFYNNATWIPENPAGVSTAADNLLVLSGDAFLTDNTTANNVTIKTDATLNIEKVLSASGNIENNGSIVFKSTSIDNTAQLDTFTGTITGSGEVTVERFIPARRAFRFLSSAVTSGESINVNWQEGAANATDNPNPGFGTHITGSTTGENGFDATPSGNPSMFSLDNSLQQWVPLENTDLNTIQAGTPYRILVRGDRSIDVTSNSAAPTNTTLRTTGTLHTGPFSTTGFSQIEDDSNFFGNPYPAAVDMTAVIGVSTNINPNFYYVWDATLNGDNGRGAYVLVDFIDGSTPVESQANQFLQPGQAAFVRTLEDGFASLNFQEGHKSVAAPLTTVFNVTSKIDLRLFRAEAYTTGSTASDGLRLRFSDGYTNAITAMDALKLFNQDENLASSNDGRLWNMESRALPLAGENIPLFTNQYRTTDYIFEADLTEINDISALLVDNFTGTTTQLENNENTLYAFTINPDNPESIATDRFMIVFEELLSTNDLSFDNGFVLFPNPAQDRFTIATRGISGDEVTVSITNVLGQTVATGTHTVNSNGQLTINASALTQGVYIIKLTHTNGGQFTTKLIKN